jgi:hypothetical protein
LVYAIGEIALVVIGILIALQINNWNEWRKDRIKEQKVLEEIVVTLELNVRILNGYINNLDASNVSNEVILKGIENDLAYSDSLDLHFLKSFQQWAQSFVSKAGFEGLKNAGLELIQSDKLRVELVNLFENTYSVMREDVEVWQIDPFIFKYMDENFVWSSGKAYPKNYDFVMNDHYFFSIVHRLMSQSNHLRGILESGLEETQRVLQLIKEELGEL